MVEIDNLPTYLKALRERGEHKQADAIVLNLVDLIFPEEAAGAEPGSQETAPGCTQDVPNSKP